MHRIAISGMTVECILERLNELHDNSLRELFGDVSGHKEYLHGLIHATRNELLSLAGHGSNASAAEQLAQLGEHLQQVNGRTTGPANSGSKRRTTAANPAETASDRPAKRGRGRARQQQSQQQPQDAQSPTAHSRQAANSDMQEPSSSTTLLAPAAENTADDVSSAPTGRVTRLRVTRSAAAAGHIEPALPAPAAKRGKGKGRGAAVSAADNGRNTHTRKATGAAALEVITEDEEMERQEQLYADSKAAIVAVEQSEAPTGQATSSVRVGSGAEEQHVAGAHRSNDNQQADKDIALELVAEEQSFGNEAAAAGATHASSPAAGAGAADGLVQNNAVQEADAVAGTTGSQHMDNSAIAKHAEGKQHIDAAGLHSADQEAAVQHNDQGANFQHPGSTGKADTAVPTATAMPQTPGFKLAKPGDQESNLAHTPCFVGQPLRSSARIASGRRQVGSTSRFAAATEATPAAQPQAVHQSAQDGAGAVVSVQRVIPAGLSSSRRLRSVGIKLSFGQQQQVPLLQNIAGEASVAVAAGDNNTAQRSAAGGDAAARPVAAGSAAAAGIMDWKAFLSTMHASDAPTPAVGRHRLRSRSGGASGLSMAVQTAAPADDSAELGGGTSSLASLATGEPALHVDATADAAVPVADEHDAAHNSPDGANPAKLDAAFEAVNDSPCRESTVQGLLNYDNDMLDIQQAAKEDDESQQQNVLYEEGHGDLLERTGQPDCKGRFDAEAKLTHAAAAANAQDKEQQVETQHGLVVVAEEFEEQEGNVQQPGVWRGTIEKMQHQSGNQVHHNTDINMQLLPSNEDAKAGMQEACQQDDMVMDVNAADANGADTSMAEGGLTAAGAEWQGGGLLSKGASAQAPNIINPMSAWLAATASAGAEGRIKQQQQQVVDESRKAAEAAPAGSGPGRSNLVSAIRSFVPAVTKKEAPAPIAAGKLKVKVKALEAAVAAKQAEEAKARERAVKQKDSQQPQPKPDTAATTGADGPAPGGKPQATPAGAVAQSKVAAVERVATGLSGSGGAVRVPAANKPADEELRRPADKEGAVKKAQREAEAAKRAIDKAEREDRMKRAEQKRKEEENRRKAELAEKQRLREERAAAAAASKGSKAAGGPAAAGGGGAKQPLGAAGRAAAGNQGGAQKPKQQPATADAFMTPAAPKAATRVGTVAGAARGTAADAAAAGNSYTAVAGGDTLSLTIKLLEPVSSGSKAATAHVVGSSQQKQQQQGGSVAAGVMGPPAAKTPAPFKTPAPPVSDQEKHNVEALKSSPYVNTGTKRTPFAKQQPQQPSYIISPYRNDDEETPDRSHKPIPDWACSAALLEALRVQQHIDPDKVFGARQKTCDLTDLFKDVPTSQPYAHHRHKVRKLGQRSSSADWGKDRLTWQEEINYKKQLGYL